jgi:tight adherence protein C
MSAILASIIPVVAAALIGVISYQVFQGLEFSVSGSSASSRIEKFATSDRRGLADRVGDSLVDRLGFSFDAWKRELMWAQLGGYYEGKTVGSVLGTSILFGSAGLAFMLISGNISLLYVAATGLLAYYPYMQMSGKADTVRDAIKRSLPEAAALIAAEMSAGGSAETAISRAAALPGPLGNLIRQVVQGAQQSGRLVFSRDMLDGSLVDEFSKYRMTQLEAFARQIDLVASKGTDGPRQMSDVARGLAREYRSDIAKAAEGLESKLLAPVALFIFLPFMLAIFVPLMASLFTSF